MKKKKRKITKIEAVFIFSLLLFVGLFLGMVLAQNNTIDKLKACRVELQTNTVEYCGPKLVNAPGGLNLTRGFYNGPAT